MIFWAISDEVSIENPYIRLWFLRFSTLVVVSAILVLAALRVVALVMTVVL